MLIISELYVYPIKSMGAVCMKRALITDTGFAFDRYWMLVDIDGNCLTQRDCPKMALFQIQFTNEGIRVTFQKESLVISNTSSLSETLQCHIWGDMVLANKESKEISEWFSKHLEQEVFLVRMAPNSVRHVKGHAPSKVRFPDSSPYLIIGDASLGLLSEKLENLIPMDRFRPNIVFSGGMPHEEDDWQCLSIGKSHFESTKLCARCMVTTIDQKTAIKGEEPLLELSKYRLMNRKIMFGHYFKSVNNLGGEIVVGDKIEVLQRKNTL